MAPPPPSQPKIVSPVRNAEGPKKKKQDFNRPKDSEPERMNDAVARRSSWDERREVREKKKEGHKIPDSPVKQSLGKGSISSPVLHSLISEVKEVLFFSCLFLFKICS